MVIAVRTEFAADIRASISNTVDWVLELYHKNSYSSANKQRRMNDRSYNNINVKWKSIRAVNDLNFIGFECFSFADLYRLICIFLLLIDDNVDNIIFCAEDYSWLILSVMPEIIL